MRTDNTPFNIDRAAWAVTKELQVLGLKARAQLCIAHVTALERVGLANSTDKLRAVMELTGLKAAADVVIHARYKVARPGDTAAGVVDTLLADPD